MKVYLGSPEKHYCPHCQHVLQLEKRWYYYLRCPDCHYENDRVEVVEGADPAWIPYVSKPYVFKEVTRLCAEPMVNVRSAKNAKPQSGRYVKPVRPNWRRNGSHGKPLTARR